jgi:putative tryptophan/tyrosine transport system substrate-binding protein
VTCITARTLIAVAGLGLALLWAPPDSDAQPAGKIPRIGILRLGSAPDPLVEAFRQGLRDLGHIEGQNVAIEYRWAEGQDERLPGLAADLVRIGVDVIVAGGTQALAIRDHTTTIPIVMPVAADPVGAGLVASIARPGGNVTGLAFLSEELPGKWMELLKETLPRISRVAILWHPATEAGQVRVSEAAAESLGLRIHALKVQRPGDLATTFAEAQRRHAEGLIVLSSPFLYAHRARLVELAAKHRLPTMYHQREFVVEAGGLMSYGPNLRDLFRRAATYVDRILKGAKPADLPVEQPTRFELVVNLKTAKALGLTIPTSVLARADEIIE